MGLFSTIAAAGVNNTLAAEREKQAREANYKYGELSAEQADKRTRALYNELYSPAAQMKQLKEAGLSPSIYASGGLAGKSGSSGAQGSGASGISPNVYGISALEMAQIANINADTKKKDAETGNITEDTTLKRLQQDTTRLNNYILNSQKDLFSEEMQAEIDQINASIEKLKYESESIDLSNKWTKETWEQEKVLLQEKINNITANTALKVAEELLTKSNIKLNNEQIKKIQAEVNKINNDIFNEAEKVKLYRMSTYAQIVFWQNQAKYFTEQIETKLKEINANIDISNQNTKTKFFEMNNALYLGETVVRMFGIANGNERFDNSFNPYIPIVQHQ